ncbi:MAG: hypothetical protein HN368_16300 [Spirochaetales bacterium]|jgi:GNAT superfamily N-acetyltransferase|nr:hypothetical protein [Spirochaetales bacterium]
MNFIATKFLPENAATLAVFLNNQYQEHWSLTSLAYMRESKIKPIITPAELMAADQLPNRIGTYLLWHDGQIISMLQIDDKCGDGQVAVFSGAETHPDYQKRGTFWRHLGNQCLREMCTRGFERLEAITWFFNRKGIPLYKRIGFRALPGTHLIMENYLPAILRQPMARDFFTRHDFIRTLKNRRSYGYDSESIQKLNLFIYHWQAKGDELIVRVDWQRKQIFSIQASKRNMVEEMEATKLRATG